MEWLQRHMPKMVLAPSFFAILLFGMLIGVWIGAVVTTENLQDHPEILETGELPDTLYCVLFTEPDMLVEGVDPPILNPNIGAWSIRTGEGFITFNQGPHFIQWRQTYRPCDPIAMRENR